ncbi:MAG: hypothetical protein WC310_05085 [Patescibacteria group bacterium]|jgi:hypothetical protein
MAKRYYRLQVGTNDYIPRVDGLSNPNEPQHQLQARGEDGRFIDNDILISMTFDDEMLRNGEVFGFHIIGVMKPIADEDDELMVDLQKSLEEKEMAARDHERYLLEKHLEGFEVIDANGKQVYDLDCYDDEPFDDKKSDCYDDLETNETRIAEADRRQKNHIRDHLEWRRDGRVKSRRFESTPPSQKGLEIKRAQKIGAEMRWYGFSDDPWRFYEVPERRPKAFTIWTALRLVNKKFQINQPTMLRRTLFAGIPTANSSFHVAHA